METKAYEPIVVQSDDDGFCAAHGIPIGSTLEIVEVLYNGVLVRLGEDKLLFVDKKYFKPNQVDTMTAKRIFDPTELVELVKKQDLLLDYKKLENITLSEVLLGHGNKVTITQDGIYTSDGSFYDDIKTIRSNKVLTRNLIQIDLRQWAVVLFRDKVTFCIGFIKKSWYNKETFNALKENGINILEPIEENDSGTEVDF